MSNIMTTKEVAEYLRLHEITICKYAAGGTIPAVRLGRMWRFDKDKIDEWIANGSKKPRSEKDRHIVRKVKRK